MKHIPGIGEKAGTPLRNDTKIAEGSYVDANTLNNPSFECENLTKMLLGNDSPKAFDPDTLQNGDQIAKGVKAALIGLEFQKEHQTSKSNRYVLEYPDLSHILGDEKLNVIKEFTAGMKVRFIVKHNNTGASTLTAFGLPVKPIKKENGTKELEIGDLVENSLVELVWVQTEIKNDEGYWELITKNRKNITEYIKQYISDNVVDLSNTQTITGEKIFTNKNTKQDIASWISPGKDIINITPAASETLYQIPGLCWVSISICSNNNENGWAFISSNNIMFNTITPNSTTYREMSLLCYNNFYLNYYNVKFNHFYYTPVKASI